MKYIAVRDFHPGRGNPLNLPAGVKSVRRGTIVEVGGDIHIAQMPKDEYLKYSRFFNHPPMLVLLDSPDGLQIEEEVNLKRKLEAEKIKRKEHQ